MGNDTISVFSTLNAAFSDYHSAREHVTMKALLIFLMSGLIAAEPLDIARMTVDGSNVVLHVAHGRANANYAIVYSDERPEAPASILRRILAPPVPAFRVADRGFVASGVRTRYYRTVTISGGRSLTSSVPWMAQQQERRAGKWIMTAVPVRFDTREKYNLDAALGRQLAHGLFGSSLGSDSPAVRVWDYSLLDWTRFYLGPDGRWYERDDIPANYLIEPGQAFWIRIPQGSVPRSTALFVGRPHTESTDVLFPAGKWIAFAWPFARRQFETEGAPGQQGWGFLAGGGRGGENWESADNMFVEYERVVHNVYLGLDGRWRARGSRKFVPLALENGKGYYYHSRGTSFVWRARQANEPHSKRNKR